MSFVSFSFLLFFPVAAAVDFLLPRRLRPAWLLLCSYFFYTRWSVPYALLMVLSTATTYAAGRLIAVSRSDTGKVLWAALSFFINLGVLAVFKYFNFFAASLGGLLAAMGLSAGPVLLRVVVPVGISFYTFQALGYTVDVYRGEMAPEKNILHYALFVSFFPQLVAGPIERAPRLLGQLKDLPGFSWPRVRRGLLRMAWGFFMKLVIADGLAPAVDEVFSHPGTYTGLPVAAAAALFAVQIYCDFGGYSAIAIGAAEVLGVGLTENFRQPYLARSLRDFWRRWHISLSGWFRDYLYIPLGGSRRGRVRQCVSLLLVFAVSGLWHGADWSFVVWGTLHGALLALGVLLAPVASRLDRGDSVLNILRTVVTFCAVALIFVFFRAESTADALVLLGDMLRPGAMTDLGLSGARWLTLAAAGAILFAVDIINERADIWRRVEAMALPARWGVYLFLVLAVVIFGVYGPGYDAAAFIYFQF